MTSGKTELARKARCAGWRDISFSAKGDTVLTVEQIRIHNRVGQSKRCWK